MTKKQRAIWKISIAFAVMFAVCPTVNAMHIMEGYLPAGYCVAWGVVCLPFLVKGFFNIRKMFAENRKAITVLAMAGAYIFVISALKIPSVTGSCSHMTGTHFVRNRNGQYSGNYRAYFSGYFAGARRTYHLGRQYLFHGNSRSFSDLRHLYALQEM